MEIRGHFSTAINSPFFAELDKNGADGPEEGIFAWKECDLHGAVARLLE